MINNVLMYLEKAAELCENKIALADENKKVTYREYSDNAKFVGTYISNAINGKTNLPIVVFIDRNVDSIVTFMGVVYSGNFYVPVDTSMPEERIKLIFDTLQPVFAIDARGKGEIFYNSVSYDSIICTKKKDEELLLRIRNNMIDTDPLYAIFTSGSTGIPKGVVVSHRSVIDLLNSFEDAFDFPRDSVFGNQAPFDFDVSVKDIYNSMKVVGTVEVLPKKLFKMPKLLVGYLCERKISVIIWAVSAVRIVSDFKALEEEELPSLDYVMFSGEIMPVKSINYWIDKIPNATYVNLYGPTEITCNCSYYVMDRVFSNDEMLPIGKPFKNTRIILKNDKNEIINSQDEVGEICVIGTCLSLGYWNNKEKTATSFIQDLSVDAYETKMYATGDMGYYNVDGDIVFASRRDFQIKHMGHRIELGEIEVALNSIDFLTVACCLYDKINEKIVCFYQSEAECKKEIVQELSKKLPKYMWPNVYVHYDTLPMNKNGKIDRVKLGETLINKEKK